MSRKPIEAALGLSLIIVAAPTHVVAAVPLKPTSRIFLIKPPFVTPNSERLRRQDPKTIQRGIMQFAAEFRTAKPLSRKLSSAVGHVLPTKDAKRKHLLGRELRPKSVPLALPDLHRQHVLVAGLHEIVDDDSARLHCSADFTLSRRAFSLIEVSTKSGQGQAVLAHAQQKKHSATLAR